MDSAARVDAKGNRVTGRNPGIHAWLEEFDDAIVADRSLQGTRDTLGRITN